MSTRLDMSPANWHGLDIFHNSQLTRYYDGANLFPSRTPETVQPCDVAHLDDMEADNEAFAVSEIKAASSGRTNEVAGGFPRVRCRLRSLD